MTFRQNAEAALRAGHNADISDPNPYNPSDPLLAQIWMKGFETMLTVRTAATPTWQKYLQGRA